MSEEVKKYISNGPRSCCAIGCTNSYAKNPGLSFFRFPKDKERCKKWITISGRLDLLSKSSDYLYQSCRLCELHFETTEFSTSGRNKLTMDALPSRFGHDIYLPRSPANKPPVKTKKKVKPPPEELPRRQLRKLSETHGKFMENWNPETSNRETRKMNRKIYSDTGFGGRTVHHYDERGIHVRSGKDMCDCLDESCPGCHYPCRKCHSPKCGHECRNGRRWIYEKIEIEGTDIVVKTALKA